MNRRPDFFIVGAPKSGTTSLYDYLDGHPDIYMSPVKEPFYFSTDVSTGPNVNYSYSDDHSAYLPLFAGAGTQKRVGEASTTYMVSRVASSLVKDFQPDARIIVMLRNPVEVIYALHNERVSQGVEDIVDFEQALAADDDRRTGQRLPRGANALGAVYHDSAKFGEQLERWLGDFGRDRVHVIVFDDFVADTPAEFRKVLQFLSVDDAYVPPTFAASNVSHRRRRGPMGAILGSRVIAFARQRLLPTVVGEDRAARLARRFRHTRIVRRPNPRPPLPEDVRAQLQGELTPDAQRLSELLGRDLVSLWFGEPAQP